MRHDVNDARDVNRTREDPVQTTYQVLLRFWRTTEAFDVVRGRMPPDGVFLKDGGAYFVSQSVALRVPIPIQTIQLFAHPKFGPDEWDDDEMRVVTVRDHPYADLGPRPRLFRPLFPGKGATFPEVRRLFEPDGATVRVELDATALRDYVLVTAGPRGNGDSGYLALALGDEAVFRFVRTARDMPEKPHGTSVAFPLDWDAGGIQVGIPHQALVYATRFIDGTVDVTVGDGKLWVTDPTTGATVVLSTRDDVPNI